MTTLTTTDKFKKAEAFNYILRLKAEGHSLIDPKELDKLLNFFTPAMPKQPKTAFQWCASACGVDDLRTFLNFVVVRNGLMEGCDGQRCHRSTAPSDMKDGFYDPKTGLYMECQNQGRFPETDQLFFKIGKVDSVELEQAIHTKIINPDGVARSMGKPVHVTLVNGVTINKKLWDQASMNIDSSVWINGGRIRGTSSFGEVIIMSMRTAA